jgi:hypothetical protein
MNMMSNEQQEAEDRRISRELPLYRRSIIQKLVYAIREHCDKCSKVGDFNKFRVCKKTRSLLVEHCIPCIHFRETFARTIKAWKKKDRFKKSVKPLDRYF